jgi:hypothetical protein
LENAGDNRGSNIGSQTRGVNFFDEMNHWGDLANNNATRTVLLGIGSRPVVGAGSRGGTRASVDGDGTPRFRQTAVSEYARSALEQDDRRRPLLDGQERSTRGDRHPYIRDER